MLSTLYAQQHLDIAHMRKMRSACNRTLKLLNALERRGLGKFIPGLKPYYLLVRNPLKRMESLYKNTHALAIHPKCPSGLTADPRFELPGAVARHVIPGNMSDRDKILALSFNEFIGGLPILFNDKRKLQYFLFEEAHSKRQSIHLRQGLRFARVLKIEDEQDLGFMRDKLGIDTGIRANSSSNDKKYSRINWSPESREIMYRYYLEDFENFGYDIDSSVTSGCIA
jgi:hypothetical protein